DLFEALGELADSRGDTKATSIRQPAALHRAGLLATELGMDESLATAVNRALEERIRAFARRQALATHLERFPEDRPQLAAVALRRVSGTDHPAQRQPDVVEAVARWVEAREPNWLLVSVDEAVHQVLGHVEMIAAGVGIRPTNVT
ncbi:MAG: hypothetical protein ACRDQ6_16005, partial [Pseudonocardiaceae bacterium]